MKSHFDDNFVLIDSIFFIQKPNKFYLHKLSADIIYVYLYGII